MESYFIFFLFLMLAIGTAPIVSKTGNHYLRPDDFPNVPADVRAQLGQSQCLIPQDVETSGAHNIVSGEFARKGQQDWVAYCSVNGSSRVIVMWGGPAKCGGDPFGFPKPVDDDSIYKDADPEQWGRQPPHGTFWKLSVIPQQEVIEKQRKAVTAYRVLKSASHDALERSSIAGANIVYCSNGKWSELAYAD